MANVTKDNRVCEFGRKWRREVPRSDIGWYVARLHVSVSDTELAADIRGRCTAPEFTETIIRQSVAYALECHNRNRGLYSRVVSGRM
jgi:hypothetical protein